MMNFQFFQNLVMKRGLPEGVYVSVSAVPKVHRVDRIVGHVYDSKIAAAELRKDLVHEVVGELNIVLQNPLPLDFGGVVGGEQDTLSQGLSVRGVNSFLA